MTRGATLRMAAVVLVVFALVGGVIALDTRKGSRHRVVSSSRMAATSVTPTSAVPASAPTPVVGHPDADAPAPVAALSASTRPVRVQIPAIGVDSALEPLGITGNGSLASPSEWQRAGWYADGVRPGDTGPAVIAGHIDSVSGPAVFYRLDQLRPGDLVTVTRQDGHRLVFAVDGTQEYPKNAFPTQAVYGPTSLPLLRLVTCTGDFDASTHNYLDNLVVTSHLVTP